MSKFVIVLLIFAIASNVLVSIESRSWGIPNICLQPPPRSEGICTIEIEGYYFDSQKSNCEKYTVGGCRLTGGQSFGSLQDCLATCVHATRRIQDIRHD
ncbi:tauPI-stichotoxin-Hcr2c [Lucilia sericata]|uniref:tauPI-stichotoxin-Hcr2c n=1 Tax=Lucilia sericata TaxID=13632 RepID=UPI0018A82992|nr:tauPI-stichotoxin-Hcr2c [Lucilia sericata]